MDKAKVLFRMGKNPYTECWECVAFFPEFVANRGMIQCYTEEGWCERKTIDRWDIETNYGDGWEVECSEYTKVEAKQTYKCYKDNVQAYGKGLVRLTKHREHKEDRR